MNGIVARAGRNIEVNDRVHVYRNLTKDTLSIKKDGLVCGYSSMIALHNVSFKVGKAGHKKTNEQGQRNVHAFVVGDIISAAHINNVEKAYNSLERQGYKRVYYNPYRVDQFVLYDGFEPLLESSEAIVIMDRVYIRR